MLDIISKILQIYMVLHFVVPAVQVKVKFFADSKEKLSKKKEERKKVKLILGSVKNDKGRHNKSKHTIFLNKL
jgi:hypothetical protein